jgi:hypothetical protein
VCRDRAHKLSEPQWLAMISNIARCSDGPEMCHELSRPYPGYSENLACSSNLSTKRSYIDRNGNYYVVYEANSTANSGILTVNYNGNPMSTIENADLQTHIVMDTPTITPLKIYSIKWTGEISDITDSELDAVISSGSSKNYALGFKYIDEVTGEPLNFFLEITFPAGSVVTYTNKIKSSYAVLDGNMNTLMTVSENPTNTDFDDKYIYMLDIAKGLIFLI